MNKAVTVLHCDRFCIIIANCPSPHTTHFKNRTIPCHALYSWLPCQRELDCDKAISYYKLQHFAILSTLIFTQPYLSQDWGIAPHPHHQLDFPHYLPPHSPTQKSAICNKQRILYIQFSALVKMVSGSKAIMFYGTHSTPPWPPFPHYPSLRTNPTNTALSLAMHYILGSLVKGSWIATRLLLIINCNILRFYQR